MYLSIICRTSPERIPDLLTYQMLIIRRAAVANLNMQWSKTDTDLWHLAFTGMAKRARCALLSLSHKSFQCNWAQNTQEMPLSPKSSSWLYSQGDPKPLSVGICRSWNRDPRPGCSFPNCKFQHICSFCARNPTSTDKSHKAVLCPYCLQTQGTNTSGIPPSTYQTVSST